MLLYIGAFQFVPLIAVMALVLLSSIAVALLGALAGNAISPERGALGVVPVVLAVALTALVEGTLRARDRHRRASRLHDLATIGRSRRIGPEDVGNKAFMQARLLVELGLDVPAGWVLTTHACAGGGVSDSLLREIARRGGSEMRRAVVRSTFVGEDGEHTHAGVFASIRDVDPSDPARLRAAVEAVLRSGETARARAYTARHGRDERPRPAVLVQTQIDGLRAVVSSRALDGREDVVVVQREGRDEPIALDLLAHDPTASTLDISADVPDASKLFGITLEVEHALGGPVQLEVVHDGARWWVVQARRVPIATTRRAYLADGPIALDPLPRSAIVWALRGGTAGVAEGLARSLDASGRREAARACRTDAFVISAGRIFAEAALARAVLRRDVSVRGAMAQLRLLAVPTPMPDDAPYVPADAAGFRRLSSRTRSLHAAQARAVTRIALLRQLERLCVAEQGAAALVGARLRRAIAREGACRDRLRDAMVEAERAAVELEARDPELARALLDASPPSTRATFTTSPEPFAVRLYDPPLPVPSSGHGCVVPIVDAPFEGRVARIHSTDDVPPGFQPERGVVYVVQDGSPAYQALVPGAHALVVLRGGVLSHLATLLFEAKVPSVLWLEPDPASLIDGAIIAYRDGAMRTVEPAPCSD